MKQYFSMLALSAMLITVTGCEIPNPQEKEQVNLEKPTETESTIATEVTMEDEPPLLLEDEPPLLLDDEPPLLLDDEPEEDSSESMADNSRCLVCHINYEQEKIAVTHARQGMGCANCHGESDEHIADESWASGGNGTAPDRMFTRAQINPFCIGCHTKEKIDTEQHKILFSDNSGEKYCTDCHGDHRLTDRKCKWK
jgi:hypothetical protein